MDILTKDKHMREKIKKLYLDGYSSKDIANEVGKSEPSIKKIINRNFKQFKEIHDKNQKIKKESNQNVLVKKIKELYLRGYNAKEIAGILGYSHGYIRNIISENLKEECVEHRKKRAFNNSIKKSINNLNNSYISNSALLKINRQSYKYNENNNLVFDEETRGKRPEDIPKVYYKSKELK